MGRTTRLLAALSCSVALLAPAAAHAALPAIDFAAEKVAAERVAAARTRHVAGWVTIALGAACGVAAATLGAIALGTDARLEAASADVPRNAVARTIRLGRLQAAAADVAATIAVPAVVVGIIVIRW